MFNIGRKKKQWMKYWISVEIKIQSHLKTEDGQKNLNMKKKIRKEQHKTKAMTII